MNNQPERPQLYHIIHIDRLKSIVENGSIYCDASVRESGLKGTEIGIEQIKEKRRVNKLKSHPELYVYQCVPFYFCPRSVMLYSIHKKNDELTYLNGQENIIHLKLDMHDCITWGEQNTLKWAFTTGNAASKVFDDYSDISRLNNLNWRAIGVKQWTNCRDHKQAEFLIQNRVCFTNVKEIGVHNKAMQDKVLYIIKQSKYCPIVTIQKEWYY